MQASSTPESPHPPAAPAPKVVYVMGAGRSGSTILGVTLGNCANVFYAGELDKWLMRSGLPARGGQQRTAFWETVSGRVTDADDHYGREAHQFLERSSALFRVRGRAVRRRLRGPYRRIAEELLQAIAQTAQVTHVVDTAHYPLRARELQKLGGIELYLIFLTRDPRSIVASFEREDVPEARFSARKTNAYLWLTYALSVVTFLRHPSRRRMRLRHEDLLSDPEGVLRDILQRLDCPSPVPDLSSLHTGFPLQGNRLIQSDVVALESRSSSPPRSPMTTLLQLPWTVVFTCLRPLVRARPRDGNPTRSSG